MYGNAGETTMRLCLPTSALALSLLLPTSTRAVDFSTEVLPILNTHCTQCHGGVKKSSGFSFTDPRSPFALAKSGAIPVVPGEPGSSELIARITSSDPDERMPPEGDPLEPEQIALLHEWIARGAQWDQHWAFRPRSPGQKPEVQDKAWPTNPIDHYVLEKLERAGIRPSPPADRPTLIRRVALDLTGLPPTPEEVDAFEIDQSPDAFEKVVDQFLASPHFGERWARHWLDQARYADSDGYEKDNARSDSWRWRQWVIDMINDDLAVDQFTIEQLAGDLIPDARPEQHLATAFHRQTLFNREGGVDPEEDRTKRVIDRATTTAAAWLGLTIQCAQCHDHPYDPITQREFYQFYAFFNNADETTIPLPKHRESDIAKRQQAITAAKAAASDELAVWMGKVRADLAYNAAHPMGVHPLKILEAKSASGAALEVQADGSLRASGAIPDTDTYTLRLKPDRAGISGLKLELMTDPQLPNSGPGRADNGNFVLGQIVVDGHRLKSAHADHSQVNFDAADALVAHKGSGWAIGPQMGKPHEAVFGFAKPLESDAEISLKLVQDYGGKHVIGRFRLQAISGDQRPLPDALRALAPAQTAELEQHFFSRVHPRTSQLISELAESQKRNRIEARVLKQRLNDPRPTYIFHRGDFLQPEEERGAVAAAPPAAALPFSAGTADPTRLDLAHWIVARENPLTARVLANSIWAHLFGSGIVATPDDFGTRGAAPSHPRLLDWLAEEFVRQHWSRKQLIKTIMLSQTYRQSSTHRPELAGIDPNNRLLHRQDRLRVEAEIVRDLHLSVSGLLSRELGGESVFPPIPADVAAQSYASSFKWSTSKGSDRYRRGMYTFFKRTAPDPNLMTFDCPDSNVAVSTRSRSNTPLMALATLQNEVFHEAAQAFAKRLLGDAALRSDQDRLIHAFRLCVARPPQDTELDALGQLLEDNRHYYATDPESAERLASANHPDPPEAAAWVATLRIITNLDEFITRN